MLQLEAPFTWPWCLCHGFACICIYHIATQQGTDRTMLAILQIVLDSPDCVGNPGRCIWGAEGCQAGPEAEAWPLQRQQMVQPAGVCMHHARPTTELPELASAQPLMCDDSLSSAALLEHGSLMSKPS